MKSEVRDYRLKARVRVSASFKRFLPRSFLRSLCSFLADIGLATSIAAIPVPWPSADVFSSQPFCAFCAFLRLFPSYLSPFGWRPLSASQARQRSTVSPQFSLSNVVKPTAPATANRLTSYAVRDPVDSSKMPSESSRRVSIIGER
jgi:hypothetical protein